MPSGTIQKYFHGHKVPEPPDGGYIHASKNSTIFKRLVDKLEEGDTLSTTPPHEIYNEHSWLWCTNPKEFRSFYTKAVEMSQNPPNSDDGYDYERLVVYFADTSFNCNYLHSRTLHHFVITIFIRMHHQ